MHPQYSCGTLNRHEYASGTSADTACPVDEGVFSEYRWWTFKDVNCVPTIILLRTRTKSVNKLSRKDQSNLMSSMIRTSCSEPREQYSNTIAVRVESLSQPGREGE